MPTRAPARGVLHVTAARGGGVDRYIRDIARTVSGPHWIWHAGGGVEVLEEVAAQRFLPLRPGVLDLPGADALAAMLVGDGVRIAHLHSVGADCLEVLAWCRRTMGLRHLVTLHDVGFVDVDAFAGVDADALAPSVEPPASAVPRVAEGVGAALREADAVVVPSPFIARLAAAAVPDVATRSVLPGIGPDPAAPGIGTGNRSGNGLGHGGLVPRCAAEAFRTRAPRHVVAVVGAIGPHKGSRLLAPLADALEGTGIGVVVVGYTDDRLEQGWVVPGRLFVHGPYVDGEVRAWLDAYGARIVLFPNRMPESFSYTLSEVWAAGRPVIVPDEGALGERVARHGGGWRLPPRFAPAAAAGLLIELLAGGHSEPARLESDLLQPDAERVPALAAMVREIDALYARSAVEAKVSTAGGADGPELAGLLAENLDGFRFRAELVRLAEELGRLRRQLEVPPTALGELHQEIEHLREWNAKLERDIASVRSDALLLLAENRRLAAGSGLMPRALRGLLGRIARRARR